MVSYKLSFVGGDTFDRSKLYGRSLCIRLGNVVMFGNPKHYYQLPHTNEFLPGTTP